MQTTVLEQNGRGEACLARTTTQTKKCPFCAEQIQAEAIKCRYCGEFLEEVAPPSSGVRSPNRGQPDHTKWYYSSLTLLVGVACLGPFVLPLAWRNPRYKPLTKVLITLAVIVLTIALTIGGPILLQYFFSGRFGNLMEQIKGFGLV